jgi:hypothetical protein
MKNVMIIKVDFCKTFGRNNMVNTIISTSTSNRWITKAMGNQLEAQGSSHCKISM